MACLQVDQHKALTTCIHNALKVTCKMMVLHPPAVVCCPEIIEKNLEMFEVHHTQEDGSFKCYRPVMLFGATTIVALKGLIGKSEAQSKYSLLPGNSKAVAVTGLVGNNKVAAETSSVENSEVRSKSKIDITMQGMCSDVTKYKAIHSVIQFITSKNSVI